MTALRDIGVTSLRWPGGTTADSYVWQRAIGPQRSRKPNEPYGMQGAQLPRALLDGPIPSSVGPDEFGGLLLQTGASGTLVVNFATGSLAGAAGLVAYLGAPALSHPSPNPAEPSYWSAMRSRNGHRSPYPITYVEVGNEQNAPSQYGWRSGSLVTLGPHPASCPSVGIAACLYVYGGTTRFTGQRVGTLADDRPQASRSTGRALQSFEVFYPPVVPRTLTVRVGSSRWSEVSRLDRAGATSRVYTLDATTGTIRFGDGRHGAIPPRGAAVSVDYESGPHAGFARFYRAIKAMDPKVQVCEAGQTDPAILQALGRTSPYDCVELHLYAMPTDLREGLVPYMEELLSAPEGEGNDVAALEAAAKRYSGRNVPVVVTEYGQMVSPMPKSDPYFLLSLDEGLFSAAQLIEWIDNGVPAAQKYLATSSPFLTSDPRRLSVESYLRVAEREGAPEWDPGLSIDSAMIAGPGPHVVVEPTGEALDLAAGLAGGHRLGTAVLHGPALATRPGAPALLATAARTSSGVELLVVNASPTSSYRARIVLPGGRHGQRMRASVLDGPSATSYNTPARPRLVVTSERNVRVSTGPIPWTFAAHSVTLLQLP